MSRGAKAAGACLAWTVILLALAWTVCGLAGNGERLAEDMLRHAPPERTGLPAREYPGVGRMTAEYLTGETPVFQYTYTAGESTYLCFREHEAAHMADCRALIRLAGILGWPFGAAALALSGAGFLMKSRRRDFAGGMLAGLRAAGVIGAGLLIWGLVDFDGLFTAFHRIAFSNDGWLLDPRTDLLIRLMPTSFFTEEALRVLAAMLAAALAADLAARGIRGRIISGRSRNRHGLLGGFPPAGGGVERPGEGTDPGAGDQL